FWKCDSLLLATRCWGQRWRGGRGKRIRMIFGRGCWQRLTAAWRREPSLFQVSVSYIYKALTRRRRTSETSASPVRGHRPRKLTPDQEAALAAHVGANSDMTLAAMQSWLEAEHGVRLSSGAVWTVIDRLGLTLKKKDAQGERAGPAGRGSQAADLAR